MSIKNTLLGEQFRLIQKIGQGSFGKVYYALDLHDPQQRPVAIKTESLNQTFSQLIKEIQNYKILCGTGYPQLIKQGISVENELIYLVTDLLGPSLEDLFNLCGKRFSLKTSLMLFYQLLQRLEFLHGKNYIHRDIKPDNLMMGLGEASNIVHMIDFGLTRLVIDSRTGRHIPFNTGKNLIGTCRYVSINSHLGYELSRRDDLLTLGYVIINFVKGSLPWQKIPIRKHSARYRKVGKAKQHYTPSQLCQGLPPQFQSYLDYCSKMTFEQAADFDFLKYLVLQAAEDAQINIFDNVFDWTLVLSKKSISSDPAKIQRASDTLQVKRSKQQAQINSYRQAQNSNAGRERADDDDEEEKKDMASSRQNQFWFRDYEEVKKIIYRAYNQRPPSKPAAKSVNQGQKEQKERRSGRLIKEDENQNQIPVDHQKQALKNYIKQESSPEWIKSKKRNENNIKQKPPESGRNPLVKLNNEIPAPFEFYQVDLRRPRQNDKEVLLNQAFKISSKEKKADGRGRDNGGSMDPRDRLINARLHQDKVRLRPMSNQIDRFGRIAFNKNRELSQASLDVKEEDGDGEGEEEEKDGLRQNNQQRQQLIEEEPRDANKLFATERVPGQMDKRRANVRKESDPMQLEFKTSNIIKRLSKFQSVLGKGEVVDTKRLHSSIGYDLDHNKSQHKKLLAITKGKLERANQIFKDQWDERDNIHRLVNEVRQREKAQANDIQLSKAMFQARKYRHQIEEESKNQAAAPQSQSQIDQSLLEAASDCSGEVPSECSEGGQEKQEAQAAAYQPHRYAETYHGTKNKAEPAPKKFEHFNYE